MNNIGINVDQVVDYGTQRVFRNLMLCARAWGSVASPWDQTLMSGPLNAHGYPTVDFGTGWVLCGYPSGTYRFQFAGQGTLKAAAGISNVTVTSTAGGITTGTFALASGQNNFFTITGTSPAAPISSLQVTAGELNDPQIFDPDFLAIVRPFSTLRMMELTCSNGNVNVWPPALNPITTWASRPQVGQSQTTYAGVAIEYQIALANAVQRDLWLNVPVQATEDYVAGLASLVTTTLNPALNVYVEYSNETWNTGFSQGILIESQATAAGVLQPQMMAERFASVVAWWQAATKRPTRFVFAAQASNPWIAATGLAYLASKYPAVSSALYGVAIAPYVGYDSSIEATLSLDSLFAGLQANLAGVINPMVQQHAALATQYKIQLLAYEGGVNIPTASPGASNPAGNVAIKSQAQYDSRMRDLIFDLLQAWQMAGGGLYNYYSLCRQSAGNSPGTFPSGSADYFAARNTMTDQNQKYAALLEIAD